MSRILILSVITAAIISSCHAMEQPDQKKLKLVEEIKLEFGSQQLVFAVHYKDPHTDVSSYKTTTITAGFVAEQPSSTSYTCHTREAFANIKAIRDKALQARVEFEHKKAIRDLALAKARASKNT